MAASFTAAGPVALAAALPPEGLITAVGRTVPISTVGSAVFCGDGDGVFPGRPELAAARSRCVPDFPCTRRMHSDTLRLRYSTIAGCQLACIFLSSSSKLPAKRYLARAGPNWLS